VRRWYPVVSMLAGALLAVLGLTGAPILVPVGLLLLIAGAYGVRLARRPPQRPLEPAEPAPVDFPIVLRGYARPQVDDLVRRGGQALAADRSTRDALLAEAAAPDLPMALRGYSVAEVDAYLADLVRRLGGPPTR
jgi:DivIVA domain-containing protein